MGWFWNSQERYNRQVMTSNLEINMKKVRDEKIIIQFKKSSLTWFLTGVITTSLLFVSYLWYKGDLPTLSSISQKFNQQVKSSGSCNEIDSINVAKKSVVKIIGEESSGSGFIISSDGFIVTNYHVVQNEPKPHVVFSDGTSNLTSIYNYDSKVDIAILKVSLPTNFPPLEWSSSVINNQGAQVIALGFPYSDVLKGEVSVTRGSVSATRDSDDGLIKYIQTDTSLNPGNSGGPLIDNCGKVIGINEIAISQTDGLNFAISSATAKNYVDTLIKEERKTEPVLANSLSTTPEETVALFYAFISMRKLDGAYELFSPEYESTTNLSEWYAGYNTTLNTYINDIHAVRSDEPGYEAVYVNLTSADLIGDRVQFRNFEGVWHLVKIDGQWRMDHGPIMEIE